MTNAEKETIIRWDEEEKVAYLYTCNKSIAEKWRKLGYELQVVHNRQTGWRGAVAKRLITFRRLATRGRDGIPSPRKPDMTALRAWKSRNQGQGTGQSTKEAE